ncbi:MAG: hypothetical protein ABIG89_03760 [Candidatus Woesearchaeota archaeon]
MCFKAYKKWLTGKIKKFDFWDIPLIKIATGAFVLMIAKLWAPLLSLDWYWYLVIAVIASIKPVSVMFRK